MKSSSEAEHAGLPVSIPRSEQWEATSGGDGHRYRLSIAYPVGDPPTEGFPVIYVLDANAIFATVVEAVRMRAGRPDVTGVVPTVVVGIGHPIDGPYQGERRRYDYTPGPPSDARAADPGTNQVGGAAAFLDFLQSCVKPEVERRAHIDRNRQTLFGHSLAGLFALHTMGVAPHTFSAFVAASPSLWWDRPLLMGLSERLEASSASILRVMVTVGGYEESLAPWEVGTDQAGGIASRRAERRMVSGSRELASVLDGAGVQVHFEEFPGEDHASAVLLTVNRFLRFVLAPRIP